MQFRDLGCSGLQVSLIGLGCNGLGARIAEADAQEIVDTALDAGITFFDTADYYGNRGGSELMLGRALGRRRSQVCIATKFGLPMTDDPQSGGASAAYIAQAAEASLRRLGTDWIDLYQLHTADPATPWEETLQALERLRTDGKIRAVGWSNLKLPKFEAARDAAARCGIGDAASCQDEYSLLARGIERDLLPALRRSGMGLIPYFPLAAGLLTGRYGGQADVPGASRVRARPEVADRYLVPHTWDVLSKLQGFAADRGRTLLELAFSWLAAQSPVCTIIAGASSPAQVKLNAAAVTWSMTSADLAEIDSLTAPAE